MFARLVLAWYQPQIRAYRAALLEPTRVLQGQHEGQGGQCSNSLYLPQQLGFLVVLLGECFEFAVVIPYAGTQRSYGLEDGLQRFSQELGYPIGGLLMEARSRALGQTLSEGFDRSTDMVDELRTATNEHFAGVQKRQVSLGLLTSVLERVQELGINSGQPGQILRVELVTFTLVAVDEVELS